mgnify:CR=1 FL=1
MSERKEKVVLHHVAFMRLCQGNIHWGGLIIDGLINGIAPEGWKEVKRGESGGNNQEKEVTL